MTPAELDALIARGPRSFEQAQMLKQEFGRCATAVLIELDYAANNWWASRLRSILYWAPYWIDQTKLEMKRREQECPPFAMQINAETIREAFGNRTDLAEEKR